MSAVIGGGPAGLAAAAACGAQGLDVMLVEREPEVGGWLTYGRLDASGGDDGTLEDSRRRVQALPSVRVLTSATCTGWFADSWLAVTQGNRLHKIRAKAVVVCAGGTSQPAVFRNNDLPGIVAASGAQRLIRHYGVRPGLRAVVLTASDEGYGGGVGPRRPRDGRCRRGRLPPGSGRRVQWRLKPKHAAIEFCPDTPCARPGAIRSACRSAACWPRASLDPARAPVEGEAVDCDVLAVSVGLAPAGGLLAQAGARFGPGEHESVPRLASLPAHVFAAGTVAGASTVQEALTQGEAAGLAAAADVSGAAALGARRASVGPGPDGPTPRPGRCFRTRTAGSSSTLTKT